MKTDLSRLRLFLLLAPLAAACLIGCREGDAVRPAAVSEIKNAPPESAADTTLPAAEVGKEVVSEPAAEEVPDDAAYKPPTDYWDVWFMQGTKVGHNHTTIRPVEQSGESLIETRQDGEMTVVRYGQKTTQEIDFSTLETPDGQLRRATSKLSLGPVPATLSAVAHDRSLEAAISTFGKRTTKTLEWDPKWGGFFAPEQSLRRQPLKPGEKRTTKVLVPMATDLIVGQMTLADEDYENVKLLDGQQKKLLKVRVAIESGQPTDMEYFVWIDRHGEMLKQHLPGMEMETYRTTRDVALDERSGGGFDIGAFSTVQLRKPLANAAGTKRVVYDVTIKNGDPTKVFPNSGSQQVKSTGDNRAQITVTAVRPDAPAKLAVKPTPPAKADLASNNLIQSDDPTVIKMARAVQPDQRDPWQLAQALEQSVFASMTAKNFSQAFATAAEVARSREGDCTEHAVLLAAMCRARQIPARVAVGLVYYPPMKGMAFHMWNEVWIGDRWIPLDATLGLGGVGGDRLKLADTNLADGDGLSTFLPVAKVMGQLKINVVEAE